MWIFITITEKSSWSTCTIKLHFISFISIHSPVNIYSAYLDFTITWLVDFNYESAWFSWTVEWSDYLQVNSSMFWISHKQMLVHCCDKQCWSIIWKSISPSRYKQWIECIHHARKIKILQRIQHLFLVPERVVYLSLPIRLNPLHVYRSSAHGKRSTT